ncbi:MAG: hypothetical protein LUD02_09560 [Tannerellaceae bacterium]|nr:hypothetical protein [Tannerellaceae bacterium]MCD8264354.1 hypothetical protein [Tannerellaceae bacterium]
MYSLYVYSGEFIVEEGKKKSIIRKGESVFIKKDNRVVMTKQPGKDEKFMGIFMIFKRQYLRELFQRIDKKSIPDERRKNCPAS